MNKLILFLILLTGIISAQVYDNPTDSSKHYSLRLYAQSARSSAAVLNADKETIDSVMYSLIVWSDSLMFIMVTDTNIVKAATGDPPALVFKISNYSNGSNVFTSTLTVDTVVITGADSLGETSDLFWLQPYGSSISSNDVLSYTVNYDTLFVHRPSSGTSALKYKWRYIKRY